MKEDIDILWPRFYISDTMTARANKYITAVSIIYVIFDYFNLTGTYYILHVLLYSIGYSN